jgi:hypothetical protein
VQWQGSIVSVQPAPFAVALVTIGSHHLRQIIGCVCNAVPLNFCVMVSGYRLLAEVRNLLVR